MLPFPSKGESEREAHCPFIFFIVCAEYLGQLVIYLANQRKTGVGIKISKDDPNISYLMFANDCIIFCRSTKKTARTIKQALDHYCSLPGQLINYHKSKVQFSGNVSSINKKEIVQILQVTHSCNIGMERIKIVLILIVLEEQNKILRFGKKSDES